MKKAMLLSIAIFLTGCSTQTVSLEEYNSVIKDKEQIEAQIQEEKNSFEELQSKYNKLESQVDELQSNNTRQKSIIEELKLQNEKIEGELSKLYSEKYHISEDYQLLKEDYRLLKEKIDIIEDNKILSTSDNSSFEINLESVEELMSLDKSNVINRLGYDYEVVMAGAEASEEGYWYENYDFTIIFDVFYGTGKIEVIECGDTFNINGVKEGLTFKQIQEILGGSEILKIEPIDENDPNYAIVYKMDNYRIWLGALEKDGIVTEMQIRMIWK